MTRDAQAASAAREAPRRLWGRAAQSAVPVSELRAEARHAAVDRLTFGLALTADVAVGAALVSFFLSFSAEPRPWLSAAAWVILLCTLALAQWSTIRPLRMGNSGFAALLVACAAVAALDLAGIWRPEASTLYPSAAMALGGLLVLITTRRSAKTVLIVLFVLAAALVFGTGGDLGNPLAYVPRHMMMLCSLLPALIAVTVVHSFRRIVRMQTDLTQAKNMTSAPPQGARATSLQLAELDLAAERLLENVSAGIEPLPLSDATARQASQLAMQLRKQLVETRHLTWLYQAVRESSVLRPVTTVNDPEGSAAQLNPEQRDGLLTALWLLADAEPQPTAVRVTVRQGGGPGARITVQAAGIRPRRVDPTVRQALCSIGQAAWSSDAGTLRIEVTPSVNPARQGR